MTQSLTYTNTHTDPLNHTHTLNQLYSPTYNHEDKHYTVTLPYIMIYKITHTFSHSDTQPVTLVFSYFHIHTQRHRHTHTEQDPEHSL